MSTYNRPVATPPSTPFHEAGAVTDQIEVEISLQIIGLFSEGLYSSPSKAIEELVSNAFDADASNVDVVISHDLHASDASIAVFDDGDGMDAGGLKIHWIVGDSVKRHNRVTTSGRQTIGKFGIGKLAAYVLGQRLTHITLRDGVYSSTTMDFGRIPQTVNVPTDADDSPPKKKPVHLDLRTLTEAEAKAALRPWLDDQGDRGKLKLFGPKSAKSWTVAVISELKPMAEALSLARLRWVLSTAMPLRDDFSLQLNGTTVSSSKLKVKRVGPEWVLGKNLKQVPKPGPNDLASETRTKPPAPDYKHWFVVDQILGPITGYLEVFEDPIDAGKSADLLGRSHGFFVYVHGRLINPDDAGFGIDRNQLRHGTFSRFRVVVDIDRLDEELRSSREALKEGPMLIRARALLQAIFNFARTKIDAHQQSQSTGRKAADRLGDSPASLAERPLLSLILDSFEHGDRPARHVSVGDPSQFDSPEALRTHLEDRIESGTGMVTDLQFADLGPISPIAVLDANSGILSINLEHPFVAHFFDEFSDSKRNLPLQLLAMSEITLEAQLRSAGIAIDEIDAVLTDRDELLRHLARDTGHRNSLTVAQDLIHAASDKKALEDAVVAAFDQLGFDAVPKGGNNDPDGLADAFLPPVGGAPGGYRVSLEAKSKEKYGAKVKKDGVGVSTIARHRDDNQCHHAIVVGPDFETGQTDNAAVVQEIDADRKANPDKTITLMRIVDLARLLRAAPLKRLSLVQIRQLFDSRTPSEAAAWVDGVLALQPSAAPYKDILEVVWSEQQVDGNYSVEYSALRVALRKDRKLTIADDDLKNDCIALARMAPDLFFAHKDRVELNIKPDKVLEAIHEYVEQYPKDADG